jgi:hypothetical protein
MYAASLVGLQQYKFFGGFITGADSLVAATNQSFRIVLQGRYAQPKPLSGDELLFIASQSSVQWQVGR